MDIFKEIFTTKGRLNRRIHFEYQIIWVSLIVLATLTNSLLFEFLMSIHVSEFSKSLNGFLYFIGTVGFCMILVRRLHDLNFNGAFTLIVFVPLIGIFFLIYIYSLRRERRVRISMVRSRSKLKLA